MRHKMKNNNAINLIDNTHNYITLFSLPENHLTAFNELFNSVSYVSTKQTQKPVLNMPHILQSNGKFFLVMVKTSTECINLFSGDQITIDSNNVLFAIEEIYPKPKKLN